MRRTRHDVCSFDASLADAREAYAKVLVRLHLGQADPANPRKDQPAIDAFAEGDHEIDFDSAVRRLEARRDLPQKDFEKGLRQLLEAEYACDQAEWERECQRVALLGHSQFRLLREPAAPPF